MKNFQDFTIHTSLECIAEDLDGVASSESIKHIQSLFIGAMQEYFSRGFKISCDGFNGECLVGQKNMTDDQVWEQIKKYFA